MKNFIFIGMLALFMIAIVNPAVGVEYSMDFLESGNPGGWSESLKTFDEEWTIEQGNTFTIDIWATDLPESIISSGFEITFNPNQISIVSVEAYDGVDIAGPWDGSGTVHMPDAYGPGSYALALVQLGCAEPDTGGDIIVAKVTFQCLSTGNSDISVRAITNFDTTVGCTSGVVYDSQMGFNTFIISQGQSISSTTSSTASSSTSTSSIITSSTTSSPSSTTSTTTKCLSESLYGEYTGETKILRYFRDNILSQTTEGRELIKLYYLWSPVIVKTMDEDEEFKEWVKETIDSVLPMIVKEIEQKDPF